MATKQEELRNLATIYGALREKSSLEKKIENEEVSIEKQKNRHIPDHPEYEPKWRKKKRTEDEKKKADETEAGIGCGIGIAQWVVAFLTFSFWWYFSLSPENPEGAFPYSMGWAIFGISIGMAIALNLILLIIEAATKTPMFGAFHGLVVTGSRSVISAVVATVLYVGGVLDGTLFAVAIVIGAVLPACVALANLIWLLCSKKKERADAVQERQEEKAERERRAAYDKEKAAADIVIAQKRKQLAAEVQKIIAACRERITQYREEISRQEKIVAQTPGLAMQDKNLYTVSTLLLYFERGKADSIKEAINLFDHEEREKARASEERFARERAEAAQRYALAEMARAQRDHNEQVEAAARRAEERIKRELDDIKNKRY